MTTAVAFWKNCSTELVLWKISRTCIDTDYHHPLILPRLMARVAGVVVVLSSAL